MDNKTYEICDIVESLYIDHTAFRTLFIVEAVTSILAICSVSLILFSVLFNKTLHFNIRLLFICFCAAFIVTNIGMFSLYFFYIYEFI